MRRSGSFNHLYLFPFILGALALLVVGATTGPGCGSVSGLATVDAEVTPDAGPGPRPRGELHVFVADWAGLDLWDAPDQPLGGVTVALDAPDGQRQELTTGRDGMVWFYGFDWKPGTASVTLYKEGYRLSSTVRLTEAQVKASGGLLRLDARPLVPQPRRQARLTGKMRHMRSRANRLVVSSPDAELIHEGVGPGWALDVSPSRGVKLVAFEYQTENGGPLSTFQLPRIVQWLSQEFTSMPDGALLDLDFARNAEPAFTNRGSIALPPRTDSPLRKASDAQVAVLDRQALRGGLCYLGLATHLDLSDDGNSIEYTLEWIQPHFTMDPVTVLWLRSATYGFGSWVYVDGYPKTLPPALALPDLPRLVAPAHTWSGHPLHAPLRIERLERDPALALALEIERDGNVIWEVQAPPGTTSLTIPRHPSVPGVLEVIGREPLTARLRLVEWHRSGWYATRGSEIEGIVLEP